MNITRRTMHTLRAYRILLVLLASSMGPVVGVQADPIAPMPVVAVIDFIDRSEVRNASGWESAALSALVTSGLSEARHLAVVDRENLQENYAEMEFSSTRLVTPESASRFGRIAKASHVIFGAYTISGDRIEIEADVIDLEVERSIAHVTLGGMADELLELADVLTLKILRQMDVELSAEEQASIRSGSVIESGAAETYYLGKMAMRRKELEVALGFMVSSIQSAPDYVEPYFELIAIYRGLNQAKHARAASDDLLRRFPGNRLSFAEQYNRAGALLKAGQHRSAITLYREIAEKSVDIYAAGAWIALAELESWDSLQKKECYRKALRIRPDMGLFKLKAAEVLEQLGQMDDKLARELCFYPTYNVRRVAYRVIAQLDDKQGLEVLQRRYRSSKQHVHEERWAIGQAMLDSGKREQWDFLIQAAKDGYAVIYISGRLCNRFIDARYEPALDIFDDLLAVMKDKERCWAIEALAAWNHPKVRAAVRNTLKLRDSQKALKAACRTITQLEDTEAIPLLESLLDHNYYQKESRTFEVRKAAYDALVTLGHTPSETVLHGAGFAAPTLDGTAAKQNVREICFPTVACIASQQNADGIEWCDSQNGYGYKEQVHNNVFLRQAGYRALLYYNPWSDRQDSRFQSEAIGGWGHDKPVLSAASLSDLKVSDCAVATLIYNIEPDIIRALDEYVFNGGGLVIVDGFGMVNQECIPEYFTMMGFKNGQRLAYGHSRTHDVNLIKVADHPLMTGMPLGTSMPYGPNFMRGGAFADGMFRGSKHEVIMRSDGQAGDAVIVREYGKGRIVIINWFLQCGWDGRVGHMSVREFYMRAVDWAGRLGEKYGDEWSVAASEKQALSRKLWRQKYNERWGKTISMVPEGLARADVGAGHNANSHQNTNRTFAVLPIVNLKGNERLAPLAQSMAPVLGSLLERSGGLIQLEREEINRILAEHNLSQLNVLNTEQLRMAGKLLGARYLLVPSLLEDGLRVVVSVTIEDVETTRVIAAARAEGEVDGDSGPAGNHGTVVT